MNDIRARRHGPVAKRRFAIGAEIGESGVHFRVWAPAAPDVAVVLERGAERVEQRLEPENGGYFSGFVGGARAGDRYFYRLAGVDRLLPDPASRYQPEGPHGPSEIIDPTYDWQHPDFPGVSPRGQVLYELHLGTFTREGTWQAAEQQLPRLAELGITLVEIMPIAEFPGRFGWGYDGVDLYAPTRLYGRPEDVRSFVDAAHGLGLGVILDVVYNHFGPDGNFLELFSPAYFTDRYGNEWGRAIDFDGENSGPVRELFIENARYWTSEFRFDGLRLDATQQIFDQSPEHVLCAIRRATQEGAGGRATFVVAENECQHSHLARPVERGGHGIDVLYNDDFHHSARVAGSGRAEAYLSMHRGTPQELLSAVKYGFLYQGQWYDWQKQTRGEPGLDLEGYQFLHYLQNHDQIANSPRGRRLHELTSPGRLRALTALLLLGPATPMLFQGQEFNASAPFLYFADHEPELGAKVRAGRLEFLHQFPSALDPGLPECPDDPRALETFERCKIDIEEAARNAPIYRLHQDLLRLRREDVVFRSQRRDRLDGAVLDEQCFCVRFFGEDGDDRLLLVNLGRDAPLLPGAEPLLAPPAQRRWQVLWSSERLDYGGCGVRPLDVPGRWAVTGESALVLAPALS